MAIPANINLANILGQQQQTKPQGIDINSLLNVPAPMASNAILGVPSARTPSMSSDIMGYVPAFQPSTPYSATNLPEFMQGYKQTPSGRFVMSQGLLGVAPTIDNVQSLFSKGYASEYDPLERQFQESFALDPSLFGNTYRSGYMVPGVPRGMAEDTSSGNMANILAAGLALKQGMPLIEDAFGAAGKVVSPLTKPVEEKGGSIFEDYVTSPVKKKVIDPLVAGYQGSEFKKDIVDPFVGGVEDFGKWVDNTFDKPEFINNAQEKAKEYIRQFKESDIYKSGEVALRLGNDAFKAYGNIENFANDPTATGAFKAIDSMSKLNSYLPDNMSQGLEKIAASVGPATGLIIDGASIASIAAAIDDPSVENLAQAYGGLDYLAMNYAPGDMSFGLPGAENIAGIGSIIGGLKALEGGIESPGEALQVATGAATAAKMFGSSAISGIGSSALSFLGPAAGLYTAYQILNKPEANLGHAIVGRDDFGGYSISSEGYKGEGESIAKPEANAAMIVLGELERNYGYKFNPDAWEDVNKRVDFNNGRWERGAHDVIIDALQKGALVPTENTPRGLDFGNMLKDARFYMSEAQYTTNKSMPSYARGQERARQMQASEAYGPEGPHPLEVQRMKMGLDPFQIQADIGEAFGRIDASKLDFSGLPTIDTSAYQPAPQPEYYDVAGQRYTPEQLKNVFGAGISFPTPFAEFTAPRYGQGLR